MDRRKFLTIVGAGAATAALPGEAVPELSLSIDDLAEKYIQPAVNELANSNSLTTIDMVTREALRIAKDKLVFMGTLNNTEYDKFTGTGIGSTLKIRRPKRYV
jgi:hypothetical protein